MGEVLSRAIDDGDELRPPSLNQDTRSKEAQMAHEEFEEFFWGYKKHSPIYIRASEWEKIKDKVPPGNYIVFDDNPFPENEGC